MNYSGKIRQLRQQKGLTQEEMAAKLHLSTDGYGKIERGQTQWNAKRMEEIAEILEVSLLELLPESLGGEGAVVQISETAHYSGNNYYHGSAEMAMKIEMLHERVSHLENVLIQKDELIAQQKQMIATLQLLLANRTENETKIKVEGKKLNLLDI